MPETPAATPTKDNEVKGAATTANGSKGKKFEGDGLPFKGKLIGMEDLSIDRNEKICLDSMFKLKAVVSARGEHKQKVQMNLTTSAVKIIDDATKVQIASHEIERISFVVIDPRDTRAFGYIYNTTDDRHQFWAIKTERAAAVTVLALKELFEFAFEQFTNAEKARETNQPPAVPAPSPVQTAPAQAPVPVATVLPPTQTVPVSPLPPPPQSPQQQQQPQPPQPLFLTPDVPPAAAPSIIDGDLWGDSTTTTTTTTQPSQKPMDDLFNFNETPPAVTQTSPPPQSIDPLADIFGGLTTATVIPQATVPVANNNPLSDPWFNTPPTPIPSLPVINPTTGYYTQSMSYNTTPTYNQPPQTMGYSSMPPPLQAQAPSNLLTPTSTSPIAPATVSNPFGDLDLLGLSSKPAKTTRDLFFTNTPPAKTMQQLQMEKQLNAFYRP
ncbi:unnamed protein product [Rotaria socialis]|uniref:PID domain-containing protein n=3 Tax=Rotaria socialis TaxID=392032 RepID=A0A817Y6Q4_9BILA|nr:unnamed protein product [Rotaria socialis]CAF3522227.1 unnamed protein product [Rotaria socialis]